VRGDLAGFENLCKAYVGQGITHALCVAMQAVGLFHPLELALQVEKLVDQGEEGRKLIAFGRKSKHKVKFAH